MNSAGDTGTPRTEFPERLATGLAGVVDQRLQYFEPSSLLTHSGQGTQTPLEHSAHSPQSSQGVKQPLGVVSPLGPGEPSMGPSQKHS